LPAASDDVPSMISLSLATSSVKVILEGTGLAPEEGKLSGAELEPPGADVEGPAKEDGWSPAVIPADVKEPSPSRLLKGSLLAMLVGASGLMVLEETELSLSLAGVKPRVLRR
jgi:hypothetical protein